MAERKTSRMLRRALVLAVVAWCCAPARARPPWLASGRPPLEPTAECHTNEDLLDLCQRCAKLTKSPLAYPTCCSADFGARKWCSDFVYFGRGYDDDEAID